MSNLRKLWLVIYLMVGASVAFGGVKEFDAATTWLSLFRGLFWLLIGLYAFYTALEGLKNG